MSADRPYRAVPAWLVIVLAFAVLLAGVAGYAAADRSEPAPLGDPTVLAEPESHGPLRFSLPVDWQVDPDSVSEKSVLAELKPIVARPDTPDSARLLAWLSTGPVNAQLLPLGLIDPASLQEADPPETVSFLSGQSALRYDGLRLRGRVAPLRVYVSPTTDGVATLACRRLRAAALRRAIAATLSGSGGGEPLSVDPDQAMARHLGTVFTSLDERTQQPAADLARANRTAEIVPPANAIASAYREAGDEVDDVEVPLGVTNVSFDTLAARLKDIGDGYAAHPRPRARVTSGGYRLAGESITKARGQLDLFLTGLRRQGYDVKVGS